MDNELLGMRIYFDSVADFSDQGMRKVLQQPWRAVQGSEQGINYTNQCIWLRIPITSIPQNKELSWLIIENPHINRLKLWFLQNDTVLYASPLTGDATSFSTRPYDARNFIFSIDSLPEEGILLLAVDNRATRLSLPLHFQSDVYFLTYQDYDFKWVLFFLGFIFFLLMFNIYLFFSSGESAFGWYAAYLLLISMFVCMDVGLFFQVLYPDWPEANNVIRLATFAASIVPMLLFFNRVIGVADYSLRLDRFNKVLTGIYIVIFVVAIITASLKIDPVFRQQWVVISRFITLVVLAVLLLESIYFLMKGNVMALFSLASFFSLTFFFLAYLGFRLDRLPQSVVTSYGVYWGLAADAFFMGLSLAWRFRLMRQQVEKLVKEKAERQMQVALEISAWKQQQMQQIAVFLHDRIGALMDILHLSVDNMPMNESGRRDISGNIVAIADEIRQYSHFYSPALIHANGLKESITSLISKLSANQKINFHLDWTGAEDIEPEQIRIFLYFCVQEMFQNIVKHSECSQVTVQVINEPIKTFLYFEDDGIGFVDIENTLGAGLKSMKRIVDLLGGQFEVSSSPGEGLSLSVELIK